MNMRLVGSGIDAGSLLRRVQQSAGRALVAVLAMLAMQPALAGPIDLRLFDADPSDFVKKGSLDGTAAGSFATMTEDISTGVLSLSNDPRIPIPGDPILINPSEGSVLRFQYAFNADCPVSCDQLVAILFWADPTKECDDLECDPEAGGPSYGFFQDMAIDVTGSGEISFLLSDFTLAVNQVFGLQIEMWAIDEIVGASALISGLEVFDPFATSVPEPGTLTLVLSGLMALMIRRRAELT
jgi:hypothetical protein